MYDKLDRALYKTRNRLIDVCHELDIDINAIAVEDLINIQCTACNIWGNRFTEMVDTDDLPLCEFCDNIDSLRF